MNFGASPSTPRTEFSADLSTDPHTAVDLLLDRFEHKPVRPFFAACLEYGRRSEPVAPAAKRFIAGITEPFHTSLRTASGRNQLLSTDQVRDDVVSELARPLIYEHVILGSTVSRERAHQLVDDLVARLG